MLFCVHQGFWIRKWLHTIFSHQSESLVEFCVDTSIQSLVWITIFSHHVESLARMSKIWIASLIHQCESPLLSLLTTSGTHNKTFMHLSQEENIIVMGSLVAMWTIVLLLIFYLHYKNWKHTNISWSYKVMGNTMDIISACLCTILVHFWTASKWC